MNRSPALVFDLDGTLVDTAPDILAALNTVLVREGHTPVSRADLGHLVGHGVPAMLAAAFSRTGGRLPDAHVASLVEAFVAHYRAHLADESRPFPGVVATLEALARDGARLGVLTNKPQELADPLLAALDLTRFFTAVHGAGRFSYVKPDARVFHHVIDDLGGAGAGAIMIGDSTTDVLTARAAGVPAILVSYGYSPDPVETLGAEAVTGDFTEIPRLVSRILDHREAAL
ncbi:MAG TPA: HAD-IA family hydrolase [Rhizomicrobium sp.]|jgi:phosphoglycolate phosphatase